ncbi:MAG: L,D-transpeptidase family protein [Armatimonadetes bacterium]|nr:L,D-transpeptidase family protein [Armatimonadota bacterium]
MTYLRILLSGAVLLGVGTLAALAFVATHFIMRQTRRADAAPPTGATVLPDNRSVADVLRLCEPKIRGAFAPVCKKNGIAYPPARVRLLAFKADKSLEVWGANRTGAYRKLATYPILAASGTAGAKKREGDRQVPEGFYRLTTLNPRSRFHVSVRVDYPNADDIAANPGVPVRNLGGDIYIHGNRVSIGCLAMGDAAIEPIFCLAARATEREVWISPLDPRRKKMPRTDDANLSARYARLASAIRAM